MNEPAAPIVAIDGPAGAGKTTAARGLAARLGIPYLDTGATFRAIALKAIREGVSVHDGEALRALAERTVLRIGSSDGEFRIWMDEEDVTGLIRSEEVTRASSQVAVQPQLRAHLLEIWRKAARTHGAVLDGRDIGTVVFPDADAKFYMTAQAGARARRRVLEAGASDPEIVSRIRAEMELRDDADTRRTHAPLRRAEDAIEIDTTDLSPEATLDRLEAEVRRRLDRAGAS